MCQHKQSVPPINGIHLQLLQDAVEASNNVLQYSCEYWNNLNDQGCCWVGVGGAGSVEYQFVMLLQLVVVGRRTRAVA